MTASRFCASNFALFLVWARLIDTPAKKFNRNSKIVPRRDSICSIRGPGTDCLGCSFGCACRPEIASYSGTSNQTLLKYNKIRAAGGGEAVSEERRCRLYVPPHPACRPQGLPDMREHILATPLFMESRIPVAANGSRARSCIVSSSC